MCGSPNSNNHLQTVCVGISNSKLKRLETSSSFVVFKTDRSVDGVVFLVFKQVSQITFLVFLPLLLLIWALSFLEDDKFE